MPTVLRLGPYRFYFYSHEPNEPPHIHVDRDNLSTKFWLEPVQLADKRRGYGIHWPDIDEDLSTEGLLRDAPAPGQQQKPEVV